MKILIINGPNLNMLGLREPDIYGKETYEDLIDMIRSHCSSKDIDIEIYQSNYEGDIITKIQNSQGRVDAIIINPAAYTHTSIAILDALKAVSLPVVEVHLSDINKREDFRKFSYVSLVAEKTITGKGFDGYLEAVDYLFDSHYP